MMRNLTKKLENYRPVNIAVVGLSGMEKDKGQTGVGKSCLCNRFVRSCADDYNVDHISVLSQSDFSGRVVNNDHFLYWGEVIKSSEEGTDFLFQLIEQTEFIDDASFQQFKGGKLEPYVKRCTATKVQSAEKLMYICKNQLGIEKEYEQKVLPDGKLNIDGFVCVFDVSVVPNRTLEKQLEFTIAILNNLMKTKKPVVLATTKNDDANEIYVKEVEKLVQKKEFKGMISVIETSAHENINVELPFIILAQTIERCKLRAKPIAYIDAVRLKKEHTGIATEAFLKLIRLHVMDYRTLWSHASKKLSSHKDWIYFINLLGTSGTQKLFRQHIKKLKEDELSKKVIYFIDLLPSVLQEFIPDGNIFNENDWSSVQQFIKAHNDFSKYFYQCPDDILWTDYVLNNDHNETRIPFEVLNTREAETVFKNHMNNLQQEKKRLEWRKQFKQLLEDTGYVTPGKQLSEVRVLFMGRECFEALTDQECQQIYDNHQRELIEISKLRFQELLLEHADIFYHFKSMASSGSYIQDDIKEILDVIHDDFRFKILDRLDQERKIMLIQHLGFIHCPVREHCPAYPNCMDNLIEDMLKTKLHKFSSLNRNLSNRWIYNCDSNKLSLYIFGDCKIAGEFFTEVKNQCEDDEFEVDFKLYTIECKKIENDSYFLKNTLNFEKHQSRFLCIYSDTESLECLERSFQNIDNIADHLPILLLFINDDNYDETCLNLLEKKGQNLAERLNCSFFYNNLKTKNINQLVTESLQQFIEMYHKSDEFIELYQSIINCFEPDIRVMVCLFCDDSYYLDNVLNPFLCEQNCFLLGERNVILEAFLGDSKRKLEMIISSFHGANAFREELIHGFILVFSTKRKASLATLNAFSMNIPNLPIQILAVTDSGGANAFFNSDLCHMLITEGNSIADRLGAHFMTISSNTSQKLAFYASFFKEVWEKKPEIEQAFNMEEPPRLDDSGEGTLEMDHKKRKSLNSNLQFRNNLYKFNENYDLNNSQESRSLSDQSDKNFHSYNCYKNENGDIHNKKRGFHVYPPPTTPPEPAPPDHVFRNNKKFSRGPVLSNSQTSLDEITSDISGSKDSLTTHDSDGEISNVYTKRAFTTGHRQIFGTKSVKQKGSQTLKQPGKLNLKNFAIVTEAIAKMNLNSKDSTKSCLPFLQSNSSGNAPLATPEVIDLGPEYSQVKDYVHNMYPLEGECMYTTTIRDSLTAKSKLRQRRDKGQRSAYSDTDSEWSSLERRHNVNDFVSRISKKTSNTHKRTRKKRIAIPVQPPRVPALNLFSTDHSSDALYTNKECNTDNILYSETNSESSDPSDTEAFVKSAFDGRHKLQQRRTLNSKKMNVIPVGAPTIPDINHSYFQSETSEMITNFRKLKSNFMKNNQQSNEDSRQKIDNLDNITSKKNLDKKKHKHKDENLTRKEKDEKTTNKKYMDKKKSKPKSKTMFQMRIVELADIDTVYLFESSNQIPLFLEKCIAFIEEDNLHSEGLYRVPGNRAHVDMLFQTYEKGFFKNFDVNLNIRSLDIPINAVATAVKDFISKKYITLFDNSICVELEEVIAMSSNGNFEIKSDKSCRLLSMRCLLEKLPANNFRVLKYLLQHFVRVTEHSTYNNMDSKNMAICWWPTLIPVEFDEMGRFEQTRPFLEDIVQTMIDQYPFLFCGKEAFVMV